MSDLTPLGFISPGAAIGLGSLYIRPRRGFFPSKGSTANFAPIIAQATIEEVHHDELMITSHPVEQGAPITDHAFKVPSEVVIRFAWSNSPASGATGTVLAGAGAVIVTSPAASLLAAATGLAVGINQSFLLGAETGQILDIYNQLLTLQESRTMFDVYTGKRSYTNMLLRSVTVTTDKQTENVLMVTATCQQILVVNTKTLSVPMNPQSLSLPQVLAAQSVFGPGAVSQFSIQGATAQITPPINSGVLQPQQVNYTPKTLGETAAGILP